MPPTQTAAPPPIGFAYALGSLVILIGLYLQIVQQLPFPQTMRWAFINGLLYTGILWLVTKKNLAHITLAYLALPYLFFIWGWLNTLTAIASTLLFCVCLTRTWKNILFTPQQRVTRQDFFAFLLIVVWVNLSGAGGDGYQSHDWAVHNTRLLDLIENPWPVRYGVDQNFVYYMGYFLPAAIVGKLTSPEIALHSLLPWTLLGVFLSVRWLSILSTWKVTSCLALVFILFGPLDLLTLFFHNIHTPIPLDEEFRKTLKNTDYLDFRTGKAINIFIGNFLSNTFQLFWSPHQIIAGWLCISIITFLFINQQTKNIFFIFSLLCLWSPLIMLALSFLICLLLIYCLITNRKDVFTIENGIGGTLIVSFFLVFYLSGYASHPDYFYLPSRIINYNTDYSIFIALIIFYLAGWGIWSLIAGFTGAQQNTSEKILFYGLLLSLFLLPLFQLGTYSDLLCRGSAPLMFLLLMYLLKHLKHSVQHKQKTSVLLCVLLLVMGSGSACLQLYTAYSQHNQARPSVQLISYQYAYENLGPDDTFFGHYFRKTLPKNSSE